VAREEVIVDSDTLISNGVLPVFPLENAVNKQERIPARPRRGEMVYISI